LEGLAELVGFGVLGDFWVLSEWEHASICLIVETHQSDLELFEESQTQVLVLTQDLLERTCTLDIRVL
jgi:hypothetical protein